MDRHRLDKAVCACLGGVGIVTKLRAPARTLCNKLKRAHQHGGGTQPDQGQMAMIGLMEASTPDLKAACATIPRSNDIEAAITAIKLATQEGATEQMADISENYFKTIVFHAMELLQLGLEHHHYLAKNRGICSWHYMLSKTLLNLPCPLQVVPSQHPLESK